MKMVVLAVVLVLSTWGVQAQEWRQGYREQGSSGFWRDVAKKQYQQEKRISKGIAKGMLTRHEERQLRRDQVQLDRKINHFKQRHYLRFTDKRQVMGGLDDLNNQIRALKHNGDVVRNNRFNHREQFIDRPRYSSYERQRAYSAPRMAGGHSARLYLRF